ncbi:MAG TPA: MarR family transcriptional regulator [Baekduia sp.]|nr:MarR family transcriptional regulator [Baekduia sp.]
MGADSVAAVSTGKGKNAKPRVSYVVGRLDRALSLALEERVAKYGLTLPQYTALSVLRRRTGLSNAQLARRTFVRPQSMMQVISVLERDGLIERARDERHRRILRTTITPKGREILAACDRSVTQIEKAMLADLSREEQERLLDALLACVRQLGAGFDDG